MAFFLAAGITRASTPHPSGRSAGWTATRGLVRRETRSSSPSRPMAGLPSGPSGRASSARVSEHKSGHLLPPCSSWKGMPPCTKTCHHFTSRYIVYLIVLSCSCVPDLMKLKRINVARHSKAGGGAAKKSDALISRFAAGFCFDVQPSDSNM